MPESDSDTRSSCTIAITCGDPNGIGPEVALKAVSELATEIPACRFILVGPYSIWSDTVNRLGLNVHLSHSSEADGSLQVYSSVADEGVAVEFGEVSAEGGRVSMQSVDDAISLCVSGVADAMVTAPISKEAVNIAGFKIPGHTEYIRDALNGSSVLMLMSSPDLKVAVATGHIPLSEVSNQVTQPLVENRVQLLFQCLRSDFLIHDPKIAVLGLNPHAGDGGVIGNQDDEIISVAIEHLQTTGISVSGPYPADGFFGSRRYRDYDGILAMYHDQGLIPFKTLSFNRGVNVTAGLSIVRTSPDHGTAFDIAGHGIASAESMVQAIRTATQISSNRCVSTA